MHQSPTKLPAARPEKYVEFDMGDDEAERHLHRASQPKVRKLSQREDMAREERAIRQHPHG